MGVARSHVLLRFITKAEQLIFQKVSYGGNFWCARLVGRGLTVRPCYGIVTFLIFRVCMCKPRVANMGGTGGLSIYAPGRAHGRTATRARNRPHDARTFKPRERSPACCDASHRRSLRVGASVRQRFDGHPSLMGCPNRNLEKLTCSTIRKPILKICSSMASR